MRHSEATAAAGEAKPAQTYRGTVIPFQERITCTITEACQAIGLGKTKVYDLIANGQLKTTMIGRRRLVMVSSILSLVAERA